MARNSAPFNPFPGYQSVPQSALFGPTVDFDYWRTVAPAGEGPITSAHPESAAIACLRTMPSPFNVCPGKGGF